MRKILAMIIALSMLATMSVTVFADEPTTLAQLLADNAIATTRTIDVPVDIQMDAEETGVFKDGPVSRTGNAKVDYKATIYMKPVRDTYSAYMMAARLLTAGIGDLPTQLENCKITGGFTIKITYPDSAEVPAVVLGTGSLYGFNDAAGRIFAETSRVVTNGTIAGTKDLIITIDVVGPAPDRNGYVVSSDMTANLAAYLPDITFTCPDVEYSEVGEYKVYGAITGSTVIHDAAGELVATINYNGKQGTEAEGITGVEISETVIVSTAGGMNAGPGSNGITTIITPPKNNIKVTLDVPGVEGIEDIVISGDEKNPVVNVEELTEQVKDKREGFVLSGFYQESTYATKLEGEVALTEDTTIYAKWINTVAPAELNSDDHIAYVHGFPDGSVKPEDNITREQISAIFYRLLKDDVRTKIETEEHDFTDVEEGRWSSEEIATMANGGYLKGYEDGSFRPDANITRAELATIAARFLKSVVEGNREFDDIDGHWAEENIKSIANNEWILGYDDGNFRPDDYITRAEAITIINRIIVRYVTDHGLTEDVKKWPDNPEDAWYYHAIIEATNEHNFNRAEDQYNEIWSAAE